MRDLQEVDYLLDPFHIPDIFDEVPVMPVSVFLEKE
jgi:hypothetical protein